MNAATSTVPRSPRTDTVCAIAYGALMKTLSLLKTMLAEANAPPAAAIHNAAIAVKIAK